MATRAIFCATINSLARQSAPLFRNYPAVPIYIASRRRRYAFTMRFLQLRAQRREEEEEEKEEAATDERGRGQEIQVKDGEATGTRRGEIEGPGSRKRKENLLRRDRETERVLGTRARYLYYDGTARASGHHSLGLVARNEPPSSSSLSVSSSSSSSPLFFLLRLAVVERYIAGLSGGAKKLNAFSNSV